MGADMRTRVFLAVLFFTLTLNACDDMSQGPKSQGPAGKLYVLNQSDNTIYVFDTQTLTRVDSLASAVKKPHYIEFSPDRRYFYVTTLEAPGHVARFNAATRVFEDSVQLTGAVLASAIAVTADGRYGYVSDFTMAAANPRVYKYDLVTLQQVASVQAGGMTHDVKITSDGAVVIACNMMSDDLTLIYTEADTVTFVPMSTGLPGTPLACGPYGLVIDHRDSLVFVACMQGLQMRVFDLAARTMVDQFDIPVDTAGKILAGPTLMAVSPDNDVVWITTQSGNSVVAIRCSTRQILADVPLGTPNPFGITMSDDGSRIYVACANTPFGMGQVYVLDGATYALVDSLSVGRESMGLIWQPL